MPPSQPADLDTARLAPLANQTAVVTGAGRGIGRAIAIRFAAAGASVVCAARTPAELDRTVETIVDAGGSATSHVADVRDERAVETLMRRAPEVYGRLDIALLGAGLLASSATIEDIDPVTWRESVDTNVNGVFYGMRAAIPHLRESGGGKIIVLGSAAARRASSGLAHYAATKAALSALVRVAARDLRHDNIAVNELQPGPTATALNGVRASDPDTLAERGVVLNFEGLEDDRTVAGEWFKSPRNVAEFALYVATLPTHGPSGQIFSYNSVV